MVGFTASIASDMDIRANITTENITDMGIYAYYTGNIEYTLKSLSEDTLYLLPDNDVTCTLRYNDISSANFSLGNKPWVSGGAMVYTLVLP